MCPSVEYTLNDDRPPSVAKVSTTQRRIRGNIGGRYEVAVRVKGKHRSRGELVRR